MTAIEQKTTINGNPVRYYEAGDPQRKSLLLLHGGFGGAQLNWSNIMVQFAGEYHLIAPDLPGYGGSALLADMSLPNLVDWAKNLLDAVGLEQAGVIGCSFGGLLGRLLAANYPTYVPVLILANGGVIPNASPIARFLGRMPGVDTLLFRQVSKSMLSRSSLKDSIYNKQVLTDAFYQQVQSNTIGLASLMRVLTVSRMPEHRTPRVPVLIMWGEEDKSAPLKVGESIQRNIPGSQLSAIAECGQLPHLEEPDVFIWQVKSFLQTL